MKIVICGLGYVGVTIAACLTRDGHLVVGIDIDPRKVAAVGAGRSPVSEPGVAELLAAAHDAGRLMAETAIGDHLSDADMVMICVGTPPLASGSLDIGQVSAVAADLGGILQAAGPRATPLLLVFRSTLPPGSMEGVVLPALAQVAGAPGGSYEVAFNPEFLRESTAIADYDAPAKIVIGERSPGASARLGGIYDHINAPVFEVSFAAAELTKLADNAFHALKVSFGNEIGRIALAYQADPATVMEPFLADTKLNISPMYLRPGGPFGGSCLSKDVRAIAAAAVAGGINAPVIDGALPSNQAHKQFLAEQVMAAVPAGGHILLLGLSFKSDSDDMRESPLIDLAETLLGKGYSLSIFDPDLKGRTLVGANLRYVEERLPHLSRLLVEDVRVAPPPALVVLGKPMAETVAALDPAWPVMDLVRL